MPRGRSYESRAPGTRQRGRARSSPVPGLPPTARAARPSAQRRVPPLCRGDQGVDIGEEPLIIEAADRGVLEDAAGIRVDEGGAASDPEEVGEGAVAVEPDRVGPVPLGDQLSHLRVGVSDVDREKVHPRRIALVGPLEDVLLVLAVPSAGEPEREDERLVEHVADPDRPRDLHPAGRGSRVSRGTGDPGGVAVVLRDVGVAARSGPRVRYRELRQWEIPLVVRPEDALVLRRDQVDRGHRDQAHEDHPHDQRVDAGPVHGADSPAATVGVRARHGSRKPSSAQTTAAGRTNITPASATNRSTTVTSPKSRSTGATEISPKSSRRGSPAMARTAKPATAVAPEARTATPVRRYVRLS